jgi:NADPH:quinone reductase-like Zn-dependent oxidoreductase
MRAAVRDRYGSPDVVTIEELDRPVPHDDEVLVRVRVASVNRADLDGIQPRPSFVRLFIGLRAPRNRRLGIDVAGVVEAVGPGVTRFRPGDRVFADLFAHGQGAFAEYVCASQAAFLPIPHGVSFEDAATLPHSAILAFQGLKKPRGRKVGPGDTVLVGGASGNVGPFAVQIAKAMGATVTGVCSPGKTDLVRSLGADEVIDYTTTDFTSTGTRYDWILDTDSHHSILAVRRALRPKGVYVTLGGTAGPIIGALLLGPILSLFSSRKSGLMLWWKPFDPDDVRTLTDMVLAGRLRPVVERTYPLDQVADALRHVLEGRARGKVLVTVEGEPVLRSPASP